MAPLPEKIRNSSWIVKLVLVIIIAILPFVMLYYAIQSQYKTTTVSVGKAVVYAQVATSSQEKSRGLCCRESLPEDKGMLFVYDKPGDHRFWMKDTKIPLDMYWLDSKKKIVYVEANVQPSSYPNTFGTPIPSMYVLETNAGFAKAHDIKVGDTAKF